ncbi:MAG: hypothetical protein Fur0021_23660 [Candidatus Promineifilaceae bacterium]
MPVLTDEIREPDPDNPKGYYEFERVKQLDKGDKEWVAEARGKVVKVISALLKHLPDNYQYKVIFMRRAIEETLRSQKKMMVRRGTDSDKVNDAQMAALFQAHLKQVEAWLAKQPNVDVLYISYNEMLTDPTEQAEAVNEFLHGTLDIEKMVGVVDPKLYRNRQTA